MDNAEYPRHTNGHRYPMPVDVRDTLARTQAFVTVLLAERAGPLTPVQQDLLLTIQDRVSHALEVAGGQAGQQESGL